MDRWTDPTRHGFQDGKRGASGAEGDVKKDCFLGSDPTCSRVSCMLTLFSLFSRCFMYTDVANWHLCDL